MSSPQATYGIAITADDKTAKGVASAEKRFGKLGTGVRKIGDEYSKANERGFRNVVRTFGDVERAASEAFGTRSVFGSLGKQVGAFRKVGSALGSGLGRTSIGLGRVSAVGESAAAELGATAAAGEAAGAGMTSAAGAAGGLAAAMGTVAVVGAGVVATLGAAAVAGYKFASGWAAATAQMGRFADLTGISRKNLQELQGAAERYGIGKDATNSAVGGFAQTVHDARYGRNNEALALMMRLGVKFRTGADGNLDYNGMLADTADALARQKDPQTALMIANRLGVAGMLPLLSKGSGNLRSEMADVDKHGVMNSDADVAAAAKFTRSAVLMSQMAERAKQRAQAWTAGQYNPALDAGVGLGRSATDGTLGRSAAAAIGEGAIRLDRAITNVFSPAADRIGQAADSMLAAAGVRGAGRLSASQVAAKARQGSGLRDRLMASGFSYEDATALAANAAMESNADYRQHEKGGGHGHGLFQWTDRRRKALFRQVTGVDVENSSEAQQIQFLKWELANSERSGWLKAHQSGSDAASVAAGFAKYVERPANPGRDGAERAEVARAMAGPMPVKVEIDMRGAPAGTRTKVTAGHSKAPAVSYAMQH